jgi:hypothetical protein
VTARNLIKGSPPQHLVSNWEQMRRYLRIPTESTRFVYTHPKNNLWWDLSGRFKGRQGAHLAKEVQGMYHLPFTQLFTEGAYQIGSTYERTNIDKRVANIGVTLGYNAPAEAYRAIESNWWDSWPPDSPGWMGCHTPTGGWRWSQTMLAKPVDTSMPFDPTAFGNNGFTWDMSIVFPKPWWAKTTAFASWTAHPATNTLLGFDEFTFHIANKGNLPVWPRFIYTGPGRCWIQDGMTDKMLPMPQLSTADGYVLVDTDPAQRTFTAATDPIDNIFYQIIRQSRILDFFLHDIEALGLPVWRRANGIRFQSQIPGKTVAHIKVRHDHPGGQVICMIPQRYSRPS